MTISPQVKKFAIVFGAAAIIFWLFQGWTDRKPISGSDGDNAKQKSDAKIVMTAYQKAMKAGETAAQLEQLNQLTEKEYGLRVFYKKDGKFYVNDTKGNNILKS